MTQPHCRFCGSELTETFADLGMSPLSNAFLKAEELRTMEPFYPLEVFVCGKCFLVQLEQFERPENIFHDYAYFSSYSDSWLRHCAAYADSMVERLGLGRNSQVVEIASNDGYLLQFFQQKGIPALGVEPAANVAKAATDKGIPTKVLFFDAGTAPGLLEEGYAADLLVGNNVLAHVPGLNEFVRGLKILLKPEGVITMEFPHLLRLMEENQFDTVYHEHFSYFSFRVTEAVFAQHGLQIFDVDELPTHGGSLRIYARHAEGAAPAGPNVTGLREREEAAGFGELATYREFAARVQATKCEILEFFVRAKQAGKTVAGYGAPAKGNTLLNFCGIRRDFIPYTVDRNPHKQGLFLPGTHIPIEAPEVIRETKPDYLFILPWNLREEISQQMSHIREWGGKFVVPIPTIEVF